MERKIISHRIGSILDDISRLSNALYAMDTTDIQRYPDNYEVLSTDAALRAEKIACRLRHLIYSSTTIRKGDYLTSAGIVHGIEVVYEDGVLEVTLPGLLPKRKQRQNTEFLLDPFYFSLEQYAKEHPMPRFSDCVVCFTQVYTPEFRETSGVGKRPVLTPDEVLRLPLDQALIIIRGKKVLQVDKMDYSKHPEAKYLRSCKASAHVPEWRRLEEEAAKTPQPAPKPAPAAKKPAKRKATKPASPTDKSPKEAPAPKSAGTPEGIITTDKDSILS